MSSPFSFDDETTPKGKLSSDQLAAIGATAIAFNEAEAHLDVVFCAAFAFGQDAVEITSRINGLDGKVEIIKRRVSTLHPSKKILNLIAETVGQNGFLGLKGHRDKVIHARLMDKDTDVAISSAKRGKFAKTLLSIEFLDGLYKRLIIHKHELIELFHIMVGLTIQSQIESVLSYARRAEDVSDDIKADDFERLLRLMQQSNDKVIPMHLTQLQSHQRRRLALPPLPKLPEES